LETILRASANLIMNLKRIGILHSLSLDFTHDKESDLEKPTDLSKNLWNSERNLSISNLKFAYITVRFRLLFRKPTSMCSKWISCKVYSHIIYWLSMAVWSQSLFNQKFPWESFMDFSTWKSNNGFLLTICLREKY